MYTNTHTYSPGELVTAAYLNSDAKNNMNVLFAQSTSTPSLLNPYVSGIISYSTNFDPGSLDLYGDGFALGCVGIEYSSENAAAPPTKQWRVAVCYTMATNSSLGSVLHLNRRLTSNMGVPSPGSAGLSGIFASATRTTAGTYTEVSSWASISNTDQIWEVRAYGQSNNSPQPQYSSVNLCFQVRTI
jgi:hypothetical protein